MPVASKATSGDKGKFEASVKGFIIGAVPDRGGRPTEGRAAQAAANMPTWKPRSAAGTALLVCCCLCLMRLPGCRLVLLLHAAAAAWC